MIITVSFLLEFIMFSSLLHCYFMEYVLQLDNCGCIITDETVSQTLAKPNNSLSKLTSLSIVGAYNLSDEGLRLLVSSIKTLKHINVTKCLSLTASSHFSGFIWINSRSYFASLEENETGTSVITSWYSRSFG